MSNNFEDFWSKHKTKIIVGAGMVIIGGTITAICFGVKFNRLQKVIDSTVNELAGKTNVHVSDSIVDSAINRAVDREARNIAYNANRKLADEIRYGVKNAIDLSYSEIKDSVSTEVARQVKNIDMHGIEREAVSKAKQAIADKLDNKMDGLLTDFNDNLKNVSKIYESIAKTMSDKS